MTGSEANKQEWALGELAARVEDPRICEKIPEDTYWLAPAEIRGAEITLLRTQCISNIAINTGRPDLCKKLKRKATLLFASGDLNEERCRSWALLNVNEKKAGLGFPGSNLESRKQRAILNLTDQVFQSICEEEVIRSNSRQRCLTETKAVCKGLSKNECGNIYNGCVLGGLFQPIQKQPFALFCSKLIRIEYPNGNFSRMALADTDDDFENRWIGEATLYLSLPEARRHLDKIVGLLPNPDASRF